MNKIVIAAAAASLGLFTAPAFAQDAAVSQTGVYGNLGYSHLDPNGSELNALHGRIGGRFGPYVGVEAEGAFGVGHHNTTVGGLNARTSLGHEIAGYAVGFYPVTPNFDVFARIGYGNTHVNTTVAGVESRFNHDSINYGAGGQYFFTGKDGVRAEYTRNDYRDSAGHANVWSVSYVRRF